MRRSLRRLAVLATVGGVALVLWKRFVQGPHVSTPGAPVTGPVTAAPTDGTPAIADTTPGGAPAPAVARSPRTAVDVSALIEAPAAFAAVSDGPVRWVPPVDGQCPEGYPVKATANSGIFHVPGGRFYERCVPERCYADADAAIADGYRQAKA